MIVTIDGPAGAGKSTAARSLAQLLGFRFLDTGAMYRAVALAAHRRQIDLTDPPSLAKLANAIDLQLKDQHVTIDGQDVTDAIRTLEITTLTRHAADNPQVRQRLTQLQREFARTAQDSGHSIITEGRDQATEVFPNAECKIYLTASEAARAQRRYEDLLSRGEQVEFESVLEKQRRRDAQDIGREIGGLALAQDSIEVTTDGLTPEEVLAELERIVTSRQA